MCQNLIWVMILLGQIHGYKSCIQKERMALFEIKMYMISVAQEGESNSVLPTWTNDTKSDCCRWKGVKCNRSSGRVTEIAFGVIPRSFSGLKTVESLDLSFNRLHGEIPPQLTELSSLAVFNVSYNNLSGVIPQGKQFNTFDTKSYLGNPFLCGQPTNKSCNSNNVKEPDNEVEAHEYAIDMVSFYWSLTASYVTILVGVLASLSFDSPWSRAWFNTVDAFLLKVRNLFW
ncbi:hypothetical protein Bca52824_024841 [Brassica carinata]|uniref:Leucine-rich repeat-containing N-terminal plant-type domain-containing protein n=1 Tax=Brassica carinata TaxID=52824 RepID=A0A8X8AU72_BRACI|nr:hypothetical protein Bca52824_024841 [Brassica carinata]